MCILLLLLFSISLIAAFDLLKNRHQLKEDHYFQSPSFARQLELLHSLVTGVHRDYYDFESKADIDKIDPGQATSVRAAREAIAAAREAEIRRSYATAIQAAQQAGNPEAAQTLEKDRDQRLVQIREELELDIGKSIRELAAEADSRYNTMKDSLSLRGGTWKYYIRDLATSRIYTNLDAAPEPNDLDDSSRTLYYVRLPGSNLPDGLRNVNNDFKAKRLEGYYWIPRQSEGYSQLNEDYRYFTAIRERLLKEAALLALSLTGAVLIVWLLRQRRPAELPGIGLLHRWIGRIPLDLRLTGMLAAAAAALIVAAEPFFRLPLDTQQALTLLVQSALLGLIALILDQIREMAANRAELTRQWQGSLVFNLFRHGRESLSNKSVVVKLVFAAASSGLFALSGAIILADPPRGKLLLFCIAYTLLYTGTVLPWSLRRIAAFNRLLKSTGDIAAGNLTTTMPEVGRGNFNRLIQNINNMKTGYKMSLESQIRSERLRTELITNVSHDLKTPLTSIINYVHLLKKEDLTPEELRRYTDILERKTERLKTLIDDLFEASKMSSGAVELQIEPVDVGALLEQALAEFGDKIGQSSLTFRFQADPGKIVVPLDGNKTWRVFENLIGNALKYSAPHTRVFIRLHDLPGRVRITMQNVSAYEIDYDPHELFERFKRGDEARSTEGSGLGLAIAKSIVDLQGGSLDIEIDGDQFKVILEFPKAAEAS